MRDNVETRGNWNEQKMLMHKNQLELTTACCTIESLCKDVINTHILIRSTAVNYIKNMGGRNTASNDMTRAIWESCLARNIRPTAEYLPDTLNVQADTQGRLILITTTQNSR